MYNENKLGNTKIVENLNYDDYDKISIDNFGKEMLYKMGWKDNQPLRKDGPVNPIELKPRNSGLGLGADPLVNKLNKNKINEMTEKVSKCFYGTRIKIISGKHKNLKGKIVERNIIGVFDDEKFIIDNKYVNIELEINKNIVKVKNDEIQLRKSKNKNKDKKDDKDLINNKNKIITIDNKSLKINTDMENEDNKIDKSFKTFKNRSRSRSRSKDRKKIIKKLKWVYSNIMVRIISKKSKYYNTKGIVEDILDQNSFSVLILEDKTIHTEFSENDVETIIPIINDDVIILTGKYRGEVAKLILRDKKKNKVSVQLHSDLNIYDYSQDDVSAINM